MKTDFLKKYVFFLLFFLAPYAQSAVEFRAIGYRDYPIYEEPSAKAKLTGNSIKKNARYMVLGTSVSANWVKLLGKDGEEGWVPIATVETFQATPEDYDEFKFELKRKNRISSLFAINLLLSGGSGPLGLGFDGMFLFNPFRNGIFGEKIDQLEFGIGFNYYLGPSTHSNFDQGNYFYDSPLVVQWLFRFNEVGSFMVGPRAGISLSDDPTSYFSDFNPSLVYIAGIEARYYPGENFGFVMDATSLIAKNWVGKIGLGLSFRFL